MDSITQHIKKDCYNFLSPYGIGDTILLCAFHKEWEKNNNGKIHFIIKPSHEVIMKIYNISDYSLCKMTKEQQQNDFFKLAEKYPTPEKNNIFIAHPFFHNWATELVKNFEINDKKTYFEDIYKRFLKLPLDTTLCLPEKEFISNKVVTKIKNVENTILLLPESHSIHPLKQFFWKHIVKTIKKDCHIIQNTTNRKYEIKGIPNIDLTLEEIIILSSQLKGIYASRSGLCDLIAPYAKDLTVFYKTESLNMREKYSLKRMFQSNTKEIISKDKNISFNLFGIIPLFKYRFINLDTENIYFNRRLVSILFLNIPILLIKVKKSCCEINLFKIFPIFKIIKK